MSKTPSPPKLFGNRRARGSLGESSKLLKLLVVDLDPYQGCSDRPSTPSISPFTLRKRVPETQVSHISKCRHLISELTQNSSEKSALVNLRGDEAQCIVDFLNEILEDKGEVELKETKHITHLLSKLAKSAQVYPKQLELSGVMSDLAQYMNEGGYGSIFKGNFEKWDVCLKTVRLTKGKNTPKLLKAHIKEVILWSRDGVRRICTVSPLMEHGDLRDYLNKSLPASRPLLILDIISGLDYLHKLNIVHSDLKAANVLVSKMGRAMLADFGLSHVVMTVQDTTQGSEGSIRWMAPELLGERPTPPTRESDIWSFGCTCYEILTGNIPFHKHKFPFQVRSLILRGCIPQYPDTEMGYSANIEEPLMKELSDLMKKCWKGKPTERPTSVWIKDFIEQLPTGYYPPIDPNTNALMAATKKARCIPVVNYNVVYSILLRCQVLLLDLSLDQHNRALRLADLRGDEAQHMVDFMNEVLDSQGVNDTTQQILHILPRLMNLAQTYPSVLVHKRTSERWKVHVKLARMQYESAMNTVDVSVNELVIRACVAHPHILPFCGIQLSGSEGPRSIYMTKDPPRALRYTAIFESSSDFHQIYDISLGLDYLHSLGIVHSSLKAANVFVSKLGRAILAGFEFSRFSASAADITKSREDDVRWTAPELLRENPPLPDSACDIWSFGCTSFEILTRKKPFYQIGFDHEVMKLLAQGSTPRGPEPKDLGFSELGEDLSKEMCKLIARCWHGVPTERPSSDEVKNTVVGLAIRDGCLPPDSDITVDPDTEKLMAAVSRARPRVLPLAFKVLGAHGKWALHSGVMKKNK
ncbi:Serine/threonine-protein kinase HT1 [Leucoagaricus sp. SymC.cos]|nr:Serine/threonine-protein kinase HT1 [Leucoagaricus sp. SymC.cos]